MKKIWIFLILLLFLPAKGFAYTTYYDCGECTVLTPASHTSGLQALATANAANGWTYISFGSSVQERPVDGIVIEPASYDMTVTIIAGVHGDDETTTTRAAYDLLNYLSSDTSLYPNIRWVVAPMINPDGRVASTRRNIGADGNPVNLNRNFAEGWGAASGCAVAGAGSASTASSDYKGPSANSEPETQTVRSMVDAYNPDVFVDGHMNSNAVVRSGADTNNWKFTQLNTDLVADGFSAFANDYHCNNMGIAADYPETLGREAFSIEGGNGAVKLEVNRFISAIKSLIDHRRYFNSHAIRMTSSAATKIGNVTYASGVLSSISLTATADTQNLEITGYAKPFVGATKTTINLATGVSTPTFGQAATELTGVPLTITAASGSLDVVISTWTDSKVWTESTADAPTDPVHVVGGLATGQSYRVAVSPAEQNTITGAACSITGGYNWCTSDGSGNVTFTYGGTYLDQTFTMDQGEAVTVASLLGGSMGGGSIR